MSPFSFYYASYDAFTDQHDPPYGTWKRYNPCIHQKRSPAGVTGDWVHYFVDPDLPPLSGRAALFCELTANPLQVAPADWSALIAKMAEALNGNLHQGTLLGVTLMETSKTISMFRNPFKILNPHYLRKKNKLSKGYLHPARRLRNTATDVWLEAQYGWNSFYHDICNFAKSRAAMINQPYFQDFESYLTRWSFSDYLEVNGNNSWLYPYGENDATWNSAYGQHFPWSSQGGYCRGKIVTTTRLATLSCRQLWRHFKRVEDFARNFHLLGLTSDELVATLWEIVPFSFVVDWFVNWHYLTRYFNECRLNGSDVDRLGCSLKVSTDYEIEFVPNYSISRFPGAWNNKAVTDPIPNRICHGQGSFSNYTRATGLPTFTDIQSGFFSAGLSLKQGVSGFALINQIFRRSR